MHVARVTRNGRCAKKNSACLYTIVHAVPAFIDERSYPIGYLMSCDHEMLLDNKMVVMSSCSVDEAIRESLQMWQRKNKRNV